MDIRSLVPGLSELQAATVGNPPVRVAVLDGPVDYQHPCFAGADLIPLPTLRSADVGDGTMSLHGTHVASLIFGQPGSPVLGIAPACTGLIAPVFRDDAAAPLSQLDLARAIEQALDAGAHVISVSGGERSPTGQADDLLQRALRRCADNGVLVVAAVGNDGCACLQVPAAVESVLAVGAVDADGVPLPMSNFGAAYRSNGILAPGQDIDGAAPGGGVRSLTGSSFATPVVAGIAALLISVRLKEAGRPDTGAVRQALLDTAIPCAFPDAEACDRYLVGTVNVPGAFDAIIGGKKSVSSPESSATQSTVPDTDGVSEPPADEGVVAAGGDTAPADAPAEQAIPSQRADVGRHHAASVHERHGGVRPAGDCGCGCGGSKALVYAIGTIGVDFGTEARRDGFRQSMARVTVGETVGDPAVPITAPANPYDPFQLGQYLSRNPWASDKLIWTLNLDRTPIYALQAESPVGMTWGEPIAPPAPPQPQPQRESAHRSGGGSSAKSAAASAAVTAPGPSGDFPPVSYVYKTFRDAFAGQALPDTEPNYVSRVSIPGVLTDRTVRLFSGQIVPVVLVRSRGIYTWNEQALVNATVQQVTSQLPAPSAGSAGTRPDADSIAATVRAFLDKVYYQFRNLGQSSADRALNFAATNAFMFTDEIQNGILSGKYVPGPNDGMFTLDTISVQKSPYCRMDSDCWDVQVTFFDPENDRRAKVAYLFTIDVSDELPVSLAPSHRFLIN